MFGLQRRSTPSSGSSGASVGGATSAGGLANQQQLGNQEVQARLAMGNTPRHDISPSAFESTGLRAGVFEKALTAFEEAFAEGRSESSVVTVIDYELPSKEKRFWVIDLAQKRILFHTHTTHGQGSDRDHDGEMDSASNRPNSNKTNVGLMVTAETYVGRHGESLKLDGLEEGFNDNARDRSIVVHSAKYADDEYVARHGKAGRSHGCPALDPDIAGDVIETIKGGKLVFAYYPDPRWLKKSAYVGEG